MIHFLAPPRNFKHALWHMVIALIQLVDDLTAILTLGLVETHCAIVFIEGRYGDTLHRKIMGKPQEQDRAQAIQEFAEQMGAKIIQLGVDEIEASEYKGFNPQPRTRDKSKMN